MSHPVKVYLEGEPLIDLSTFEWQMCDGVTPYSTTFPMLKSKALALLALQRERAVNNVKEPYLTLTMTDHFDTLLRFRRLYLLPPTPYTDFRFLNLTLVDCRYFWDRIHFNHAFNVRGKMGDKMVLTKTGELGGLGLVPNDTFLNWGYRSISLFPPQREKTAKTIETARPWKLPEIIDFIMRYFQEHPDAPFFGKGNIDAIQDFKNVIIEELWLDGSIANAMQQVLSQAQGLGLFIDDMGNVNFYNKM